jgi:NAD(P)-dependent dehydrogenase (short-subunit alcohol dehydrogenase family)
MLLANKSAVVTGAGAGVGLASALRFAEEGARVICADISLERVKDAVRQIEAAGGTAIACEADVSKEADVEAMVGLAVEQFGRLDIMYNNAGIATPTPGALLEDHTVEQFDRLVGVNLRGVFLGIKHAVLQFKRQGGGGVIINTGSVAGMVGWGGSVYGSTKGGVNQITKGAAIEGAPFDIRVNAICPAGMPYTQFMAAVGRDVPPDQREAMAEQTGKMHPLGRPITAEDCAEAAVFLASDLSKNITGVLLPIDGGYVAR